MFLPLDIWRNLPVLFKNRISMCRSDKSGPNFLNVKVAVAVNARLCVGG